MKKFDNIVSTDKVTLQKIKFGIQQMMSSPLMKDIRYESVNDIGTQTIIKSLTFYLWGNKVNVKEYDTAKTYPATMWEELKLDFCPNWLKRKFPVRYSKDVTHHTVTHWHVCPHLNYETDSSHLNFMVLDDTKLEAEDYETHRGKIEGAVKDYLRRKGEDI